MSQILLITYHYPPDAAVGAIRPAALAKFLSEFGWNPIILSVREQYYDLLDNSPGESAVGRIPVVRTGVLTSPSQYYRRLKRLWQSPAQPAAGTPASPDPFDASPKVGVRRIVGALLSFPDERVW